MRMNFINPFNIYVVIILAVLYSSCVKQNQKEKLFPDFHSLSDSLSLDSIINNHEFYAIKIKWKTQKSYWIYKSLINNNWLTKKGEKVFYFRSLSDSSYHLLFDLSKNNSELIESFYDSLLDDSIYRIYKPCSNQFSVADSLNVGFLISMKKGIMGVYMIDQTDYIKKYYGKCILHSIIGNIYAQRIPSNNFYIIYEDKDWPSEIRR